MKPEQKPEDYNRSCPGHGYKISDAVCKARQVRNYPLCEDCEYHDEPPKVQVKEKTSKMRGYEMDKIFKAYDIRGVYPDQLDDEKAWCIGHGTAQFFRSQLNGYDRSDPKANVIALGRDMRKSSPSLRKAFVDGVLSAGVNIIDIGMIDTSQMYFAVNYLNTIGGVQITASHNPGQYNGFKITGQKGKPIGQETGLEEIRRIAQAVPHKSSTPQAKLTEQDISQEYKKFLRKFVKEPVRKLKIAVDASNGMAGKYWPIVFGGLQNIETIDINFEHNGDFVHDPNPLVEANLKQCQAAIIEQKADFGICMDGDADRCMLVDEKGERIPCDLLTALLAGHFLKENPGSTIVYDLRSSWVVKEEITRGGGTPRKERVGHAFMKKTMAETDAVFGGEVSGHFYFRDNWYCDSAFLAVANILNLLTENPKPVSEIIAPLRRYASSGERNFTCEDKDERINGLKEKYKNAKIDFLDGITVEHDDWWFNVRKSNTEPLLRLNMEAKSPELLEAKLEEISPLLGIPAKE